ncbi:hypothetical protein HYE82_19600 [Streptomyces sp. BR123]|nr:hypothetical protein [Streptomyces sp. BR123]
MPGVGVAALGPGLLLGALAGGRGVRRAGVLAGDRLGEGLLLGPGLRVRLGLGVAPLGRAPVLGVGLAALGRRLTVGLRSCLGPGLGPGNPLRGSGRLGIAVADGLTLGRGLPVAVTGDRGLDRRLTVGLRSCLGLDPGDALKGSGRLGVAVADGLTLALALDGLRVAWSRRLGRGLGLGLGRLRVGGLLGGAGGGLLRLIALAPLRAGGVAPVGGLRVTLLRVTLLRVTLLRVTLLRVAGLGRGGLRVAGLRVARWGSGPVCRGGPGGCVLGPGCGGRPQVAQDVALPVVSVRHVCHCPSSSDLLPRPER